MIATKLGISPSGLSSRANTGAANKGSSTQLLLKGMEAIKIRLKVGRLES